MAVFLLNHSMLHAGTAKSFLRADGFFNRIVISLQHIYTGSTFIQYGFYLLGNSCIPFYSGHI